MMVRPLSEWEAEQKRAAIRSRHKREAAWVLGWFAFFVFMVIAIYIVK